MSFGATVVSQGRAPVLFLAEVKRREIRWTALGAATSIRCAQKVELAHHEIEGR
jgi:hypothetical protein